MYEVCRTFMEKLKHMPSDRWKKGDQACYRTAWKHCRSTAIRQARLLITTCNTVWSPEICNHFSAGEAKPSAIIFDGINMEIEVNALSFLNSSKLENCVGMFLVGNKKQVGPTAVSSTANINEFAEQLCISLLDRLTFTRFPCVELRTQPRMHPNLALFPSNHTYSGKLLSDLGTRTCTAKPDYVQSLQAFLAIQPN